MRNIHVQSKCYRFRSDTSSFKWFKPILLATVIIIATCGVIRSQEPVVVTTVKRPAETVKKDSVPPPQVTPAVVVQATTPDTSNKKSDHFLDNIVLKSNSVISYDRTSIGFGLGQEYGGIGGNILSYPHKNFGMFFGLGYNFVGVGYNLGLKSRIALGNSSEHIAFYGLLMYGYNAVIIVENSKDLSKVFHGFTLGAGIETRPWSFNDDYISIGLNFPLRSSRVQEYVNYLKNSYYVEFERELLPVTFSIAYRITIN